jgi:hypothetical protein
VLAVVDGKSIGQETGSRNLHFMIGWPPQLSKERENKEMTRKEM